jgi:hypothetical protein
VSVSGWYFESLFIIGRSASGVGASSKSIRRGGENSSSNCLFLTLQINAPKKTRATEMLAISNRMITLMFDALIPQNYLREKE